MLTRFQGWTSSTLGTTSPMPRTKSLGMGIKKRAKNFLARPGIKKAVNRIGGGIGTGTSWAKNAFGSIRKKTGFSAAHRLTEFRRRNRFGKRKPSLLRRLVLPSTAVTAAAGLTALSLHNQTKQRAKLNPVSSMLNPHVAEAKKVNTLRNKLQQQARLGGRR